MKCRHCNNPLRHQFIDLGSAPPSNAYLTEQNLKAPEFWFPLRVLVCERCWLVQTEDLVAAEQLFDREYAYFSSFSTSWLIHCERYVQAVCERYALTKTSHVVEIAANDGYLLQYFAQRGIPCLGIEPTASTARAARAKGLEILEEFFGLDLARKLSSADLIIANNVLAHVPDINDFCGGISALLSTTGVVTFEFPHLMELIKWNQFDTIYHEHFSYLSLSAVVKILSAAGLAVFDVEQLATHGGSLRVHAQRATTGRQPVSDTVASLLAEEERCGLVGLDAFHSFQQCAEKVKDDLLSFLLGARKSGKRVAAYGAAAKGNTLLNFAGVRPDLVEYVVDKNPHKQGSYMPGSRIPIVGADSFNVRKPDFILILPWNLSTEIEEQLSYVREWGSSFVSAVPQLRVW